ncbi:carbohydrate sulfotransferase 11-like [Mizuhopecten yessoensis]|uniref:carbohydrate sulfotransferase 11-like n=1 Tax=Mizuhopecten yessoensis TaxID=6573 RepID=UPI000B45A6BA|nr:carbohydrate sulfotransferase 11-like [Mizuhopecten yessoensis]
MLIKLGNMPTLKIGSHKEGAERRDKNLSENNTRLDRETDKSAVTDNIKRVWHLRQECKRYSDDLTKLDRLSNLIVDDKYKTLFCYIPKIACSQWKSIFITLTGKVNSSRLSIEKVHDFRFNSVINLLSNYPYERRKRILKEYKKSMIVRNPLERLLSAYRNKIERKGKARQFQTIRETILERYRSNMTQEFLAKDDYNVTFFEFVKFVTDEDPENFNSHWKRYTTLCSPCIIKYDFIGKYESIYRDANFILRDLGAPPNIRFPQRSETYHTIETMNIFEKFYSQIPAEYITKLWNIYRPDYELFGYSLNDNFKLKTHS